MENKKIITLLYILFLSISSSYAQKYGKIFLNENGIKILNSQEKNYVKKSVYEVVYFTGAFDLIIGEFKNSLSKEESYSIDVKITSASKDNEFANVELKLRELKNNKAINLVKAKNVPRIKLQYTVRKLLFKLFYEENYDEKEDKILKNEIIPIADISSNTSVPNNLDKENELSKDDAIRENNSKKKQDSIDSINKKKEKSKKKRKKIKVRISKFESPDIDISINKESKLFIPTSFELHNKIYINIGQSSNTIESSSIIETTTEISQFKFDIGSRFSIGDRKDFYDLGVSGGQILGENPSGLAPGINFHFAYAQNIYKRYVFVSPTISYETLSFADLSSKGEGIVPWSNSLMWVGAKGRFHLFDDKLEFYGGYEKSIIGTSDLGRNGASFPIEGTKLSWGLMSKVYKKIGLGANVDIISLSSSASRSFKADYESFKVFLTYR